MTIRPNYYRVDVKTRVFDARNEERASTLVELECQDLIEGLGLDFNLGNAQKYLFRTGRKGDIEDRLADLKKIQTYIGFAVDAEQAKQAKRERLLKGAGAPEATRGFASDEGHVAIGHAAVRR